MNVRYSYVPLLLLLLALAACAPSINITSAPSPSFHLADYKTFAFYDVDASGSGLPPDYSIKVNMLQEKIAQELQARGVQQVTANPELLVNIGVVIEDEVQTRQTDFRTDAPVYVGQRRYTWESKEVPVRRYKTGSVTVDFIASSQNDMVWQGTAEGVLPSKTNKLTKLVQQGMRDLIARVPQ